jgi:hypothetical protein
MTRITVRYFIDGSQVDEAEAHLADQAKALDLIGQLKRDLAEVVSSVTRDAPALSSETVRLLRLERALRDRMVKDD